MTLEQYLNTRTNLDTVGKGLRFFCDDKDGCTYWRTDDDHTVLLSDTGDVLEIDGELCED